MSYPKAWADMGDGETNQTSKRVREAMDLSFRAIIEGRSYEKPTWYDRVEGMPEGGECLAQASHTEGYPSGGSVTYACHAYRDAEGIWHYDGEWSYKCHNIQEKSLKWFKIRREER